MRIAEKRVFLWHVAGVGSGGVGFRTSCLKSPKIGCGDFAWEVGWKIARIHTATLRRAYAKPLWSNAPCSKLRSAFASGGRGGSFREDKRHVWVALVARYSAILRYYTSIAAIPPVARYPSEDGLTCDTPPLFCFICKQWQRDRGLYGGYSAIGCYTWKTKSDRV